VKIQLHPNDLFMYLRMLDIGGVPYHFVAKSRDSGLSLQLRGDCSDQGLQIDLRVEDGQAKFSAQLNNVPGPLANPPKLDLLKVQSLMNAAFQNTGELEYAEMAAKLSVLTGMVQGPHGEWEAA
jgi:hypothetical protein